MNVMMNTKELFKNIFPSKLETHFKKKLEYNSVTTTKIFRRQKAVMHSECDYMSKKNDISFIYCLICGYLANPLEAGQT